MQRIAAKADSIYAAPTRLRMAREYRGITRKLLAELVGCTPMNISGYEKGSWTPSYEILKKIAFVLDFPAEWFLRDELSLTNSRNLTFRARSSMTATTRNRATATWDIAVTLSEYFQSNFNLPTNRIPDLSSETPELAAKILRDEWRLGDTPIPNLVRLLESKGAMIFWSNIEGAGIDAYCNCHELTPIIILNSHVSAGERLRFNLAHELGHLVLHRNSSTRSSFGEVRSNFEYSDGDELSIENKYEHNKIENEAHRFAASLLVPESMWRLESPVSPVPEFFLSGKAKWRTSIQMLVRRSYDLNRLTEWQYESLMRQISVRGWRKEEPNPLPAEVSLLHRKLGQILVAQGVKLETFCAHLDLCSNIIVDLAPELANTLQHRPTSTERDKKNNHHLRFA